MRILTVNVAFDAIWENTADADVAALDPLGADAVMAELPAANARRDTTWILEAVRGLVGRSRATTAPDARAALRDLGFLASSALRHDEQADLTFLEPELARLGQLCSEVPRDTVYSYTTRNPSGERRRTYNDSDEEHLFIDSVTTSTASLNLAVEHLAYSLLDDDRDGEELTKSFVRARDSVDVLRRNLLAVKRRLSPEYFSNHLRPYFPHITVDGKAYAGPGGAQMPLLVLDVLLLTGGADDNGTQWHHDYLKDNVIYLPPAHRAVCHQALVRLRRQDHRKLIGVLREHDDARTEFAQLMKDTLKFRYPHRQLARANMAVRPEGSLGSGGYTAESLDHIIELTRKAFDEAGAA